MDYAFAIVVFILAAVGIYWIVRPGIEVSMISDSSDTPAPAEPMPDLPSESALLRMKKADLIALAEERGLDVAGTKSDIVSQLINPYSG